MNRTTRLRTQEHSCLIEALRRRSRFHLDSAYINKPIWEQWTGLGSATAYKQAVKAGYMTVATSPNPGHMTWWKLTPKGALVIAFWIGQGFNHERIEKGELPSTVIPSEVLTCTPSKPSSSER